MTPLKFNNLPANVRVTKDESGNFTCDLFINDLCINKGRYREYLEDLSQYEGLTLDCTLNGKELLYEGRLFAKFESVFDDGILLTLGRLKDRPMAALYHRPKERKVIIFCTVPFDELPDNLFARRKKFPVIVTNDETWKIVRYANLHQHTEYSLLDGMIKTKDLAKKTEYAAAITDHGNMHGFNEFYKEMKKRGKKPIIGCEIYLETPGNEPRKVLRLEKNEDSDNIMFGNEKEPKSTLAGEHLILLAENNTGLHNLFYLVTHASEHFYRKPHVTIEMLEEHSEGLIATSACIASCLGRSIKEIIKCEQNPDIVGSNEVLEQNKHILEEFLNKMIEIFGKENFFIELQDHHFPLETEIMKRVKEVAKEYGLKTTVGIDAHYLNKEDTFIHELWLCQQTKKTINDPDRMRFSGDGYYVHTSEEVLELFPDDIEALDNTLDIADRCDVTVESKGYHMPKFPLPDGFEDEFSYLKYLAEEGFKGRFPALDKATENKYRNRLNYELDVIKTLGWPGYFLVVADYIAYAKDKNVKENIERYFPKKYYDQTTIPEAVLKDYEIYVGPGRGCVNAGTLIFTENGLKPIETIQAGEMVYTHTGALKEVTKTYKYPVKADETLIRPKVYYGDNRGCAFTPNHKLLVLKAVRSTARPGSIGSRRVYEQISDFKAEWIEAKDVEVGDMIAFPKLKRVQKHAPETIDLAKYASKNAEILEESILEKSADNKKNPFSIHEINRKTGITRKTLRGIYENSSVVRESSVERLANFLKPFGMTIDDWREQKNISKANNYKRFPRFVKVDDKLMYFLGAFVGNGWIRKDNSEAAICFNVERLKNSNIIADFKDIFGIELVERKKQERSQKVVAYSIPSKTIALFLLAFLDGYEGEAQTKSFSDFVFDLDDELKYSFIAGLWFTDGYNGDKTSYDTSSLELAHKIRLLLATLGIPSSMQERECYINMSDNRRTLYNDTSYKITVPRNFKRPAKQFCEYNGDYIYKRVYAIESKKADFVYDITVKDDHSYVTSNFIAHNSGAGSLVTYCTGITDVDPIKYDLLFERFLNPDRISAPDIDSDFEDSKRSVVVEYCRAKYGADHVSGIITFGTSAAKNAIRSVTRVLGKPVSVGSRIANMIPKTPKITIKSAMMENQDLKADYENNPETKEILDYAMKIEGLKTNKSLHACFTADMVVTTSSGLKYIKDIRPKDKVLTHTGRFCEVGAVSLKTTNILARIKVEGRSTIKCTPDHLFLVNENNTHKWVPAKDLKPGTRLVVSRDPQMDFKECPAVESVEIDDNLKYARAVYDLSVYDDNSYTIAGLAVHNCGKLVTDKSITEYMPEILMADPKTKEEVWTTQIQGPECEEMGCLKMDFLGLRQLGLAHDCINSIKKNFGIEIDYNKIPIDDPDTYKFLLGKDTTGVFQAESELFTKTLAGALADLPKKLKQVEKLPDDQKEEKLRKLGEEMFLRVADVNALVRPGPNQFVDTYNERVLNPEKTTYDHPSMEAQLKSTFGIMLYQEQVMLLCRDMAGFSGGDTDSIRKAMGKKIKHILDEYREYFIYGSKEKKIKGCVANGIPESVAKKVWADMETFSLYAFNRSHSIAYSIHTARTAWLVYHYPVDYMAALLNSFIDNQDKTKIYLLAAKQKGIAILPPSVNKSNDVFAAFPKENSIRFGLGGIKYVGSGAEAIIEEREVRGEFSSLSDFLSRMATYRTINKRMIESLIYSGALDEFPGTRQSKIAAVPDMLKFIKKVKDSIKKLSVFEVLDLFHYNILTFSYDENIPEMSQDDILKNEAERLGYYASAHPLDKYNKIFRENNVATIASLKEDEDKDDEITATYTVGRTEFADVVGIVKGLKKSFAKSSGKPFWSFVLEDQTGDIKCVYFGRDGDSEAIEVLTEGAILFVHAKVQRDDFGASLVGYSLTLAEDYIAYTQAREIVIVVGEEGARDSYDIIKDLLSKARRGKTAVRMQIKESGKEHVVKDGIKLDFQQFLSLQRNFGKKQVVPVM